MKFLFPLLGVIIFVSTCFAQNPTIDRSPDRVKLDIKIPLKKIGTLQPRGIDQVSASRWTIGCEVLDRDFVDYHEYKEYLAPLGIKRLRLQAGWAKTEKKKGEYDWTWLDSIVDDACRRGLVPWLQTSYGNPIYPGGGVGNIRSPFPAPGEALDAWDRWVEAMATRYKDKVVEWEMWNEPDLDHMHNGEEVALFNIRTAKIIRKIQPKAKIAGFNVSDRESDFAELYFKTLAENDAFDLFNAFTYHSYARNPDEAWPKTLELEKVLKKYNRTIPLWQGECGCPSTFCITNALDKHYWTELSQPKWILRRTISDLGHGHDTTVFTIADINYAAEIGTYGLLRPWSAPFDNVRPPDSTFQSLAEVVGSFDVETKKVEHSFKAGQRLDRSAMAFSSGLLALRLADGVSLIMEGPLNARWDSDRSLVMERGKLSVQVPPEVEGFVVKTPHHEIRDLGTEFFLNTSPDHCDVDVVSGRVEVVAQNNRRRLLSTGEQFSSSPEKTDMSMSRYRPFSQIEQRLEAKRDESRAYENDRHRFLEGNANLLVDFAFESIGGSEVPNRAAAGRSICPSGKRTATSFASGSRAEKTGLTFSSNKCGVRFSLPKRCRSVTLLASLKLLHQDNICATILGSREAGSGTFSWQINRSGALQMLIQSDERSTSVNYDSPPFFTQGRIGVWYVVATVIDAEKKDVVHYIDGEKLSSHPLGDITVLDLHDLTLGNSERKRGVAIPRQLDGTIDELFIFDRSLTDGEIRQLSSSSIRISN